MPVTDGAIGPDHSNALIRAHDMRKALRVTRDGMKGAKAYVKTQAIVELLMKVDAELQALELDIRYESRDWAEL